MAAPPEVSAGPDLAEAGAGDAAVPGGVIHRREGQPFEVHLDVFSGPFELLLGLIAKHKLDVTEIALAKVTDEFVAHIRTAQQAARDWDLSEASEFLLVAATLLDLKASRLLPTQREDDEEDLALIEARDLLFARLLQYRAFKQVATELGERMATVGRIFPRDVGVEDRFSRLLPELVMGVAPEQLAAVAAQAMVPKPPPTVGIEHLHAGHVSVREQAGLVVARLRRQPRCSFRDLVADADSTLVIVARFLALLELFREGVLAFAQDEALGGLDVHWEGPAEGAVGATEIGSEFDEGDPAPAGPGGET
ncbi:segregation and condensation protein A [Ornithinicoccus halotolerans]|uniref:segregation and condensation protein A n=1 Tax=Ornithinicoccus halotolerans TaxID=1748220 RepID=UPI00129517BD|nr:ScpA family protein [Ornithinicoccus halotolerans]